MTRSVIPVIGLALALAVARPAEAQWNVARYVPGSNRLYSTVGVDPALVAAVGYGRTFRLFGRPLQAGLEAGAAGGSLDLRDFRARLGANILLLDVAGMQLTGRAAFVTRGTSNTIYRALDMGADVGGTLGIYRRGWFAAGEAGFDKAIITHLTHSDWYRRYIYPDAKDGWYLTTGGTWQFGGMAGLTLGRSELVLRAGTARTQGGRKLAVPFYADLGVGVSF